MKVDISQFEQVIVNLAVNARDAMPDGGKLTVRTANVTAADAAKFAYKGMPDADYVLVEVSDTGIGIPTEIIDKIFEPFFYHQGGRQGDRPRAFDGLRHRQADRRLRLCGVAARTDDVPHFPAAARRRCCAGPVHCRAATRRPSPALAAAERAANADLTGQGTILLVEDEDGLRALNARGLASRGYTVLEAGNGVEAIEALGQARQRVDLVVSDVVMPEMDGPTLLKELRRRDPNVKIHFRLRLCRGSFQPRACRRRTV